MKKISLFLSLLMFTACTDHAEDPAWPAPAPTTPIAKAGLLDLMGVTPDMVEEGTSAAELITPDPGFNVIATGIWHNEGFAEAIDDNGNSYLAGYNFLPPPSSDYYASIRKFNQNGVEQGGNWPVTVNISGSPSFESWMDVALSSNGASVYAVGYTPSNDWRVSKYTSAGVLVWTQTYSTTGSDQAYGVDYDDATDTLVVVGQWNGAGHIKRLTGTGTVIGTSAFAGGIATDVVVATVQGHAGPFTGYYVIGGTELALYDLFSGSQVWTRVVPGIGRGVSVDVSTGRVCAGGYGQNLVTLSSGFDGWARSYDDQGTQFWAVANHVGSELFAGIAAQRGGGCVAAGERAVGTGSTTDLLVVQYDATGAQIDSKLYDHAGRPNPSMAVTIPSTGTLRGKAIVTARTESINGGPGGTFSYDAWLRRFTL